MSLPSVGRVLADLPGLISNPGASRSRILAFQERRLRELVAHAYDHVPYYRDLFDRERLIPRDIRTVSDLGLIPLTSKGTLQSLNRSDIVARGTDDRRLVVRKTTGTTGLPLTIYRSRAEGAVAAAMVWRVRREFGVRAKDKVVALAWKAPGSDRNETRKAKRGVGQRVLRLPSWMKIDCVQPLDMIAAELRTEQPDVILGYAGVLARLVESLRDEATDIRPRLVVSVSEVLTSVARARIEKVLGAPVRDVYAAWELGLMAYECGAGGPYHTCDDNVILEVRHDGKAAGAGESGEVIGTSLHYAAMPFIRYEIGDVATRGPEVCGCGGPFGTLLAIHGRTHDYFQLPDGRVIHPLVITGIIREAVFRSMKQYQIIQETPARIVARVVLRSSDARNDVENVFRTVEAFLGPGVVVTVEYVDDIPPGAGGKIGEYRSLVTGVA